jgi:epoxyqueuosine reductase QueG
MPSTPASGWIGKNTCVINPGDRLGIFLAAIICSLPLDVDAPSLDQCGSRTLCIEACPTQAIVAPACSTSTRCISHLTIELRGDIPQAHRAAVGSHVRLRHLPGRLPVERQSRRGQMIPPGSRARWIASTC